MSEQARREAAMRRRLGQDEEVQKSVIEINAAAPDWRGRCRKCGAALSGTLAELQAHRCADGG